MTVTSKSLSLDSVPLNRGYQNGDIHPPGGRAVDQPENRSEVSVQIIHGDRQ